MFDKEKIRSKIQIIEDNMAKLSVLSKYSYEFLKVIFEMWKQPSICYRLI